LDEGKHVEIRPLGPTWVKNTPFCPYRGHITLPKVAKSS
jgi:hypothetical protein